MIDYSFFDPRLLFPHITEGWALAIELVVNLLNLIALIMIVVAEWKLFKKIGEKPWKSLIPYYNFYILYKHIWSKKPFWIYLVTTVSFEILEGASKYLSQNKPDSMWMTLLILIALPFGIASTVCNILYVFRLSEAFGKGKGFAIGLWLLYPIFISILAFGKFQYIGECNADQTESEKQPAEIEGEVL
jgi:hypothetical protein